MSAPAAPPQPLLCLLGPENWYNYDGDFSIHGEPIKLVQEGGQVRLCLDLASCPSQISVHNGHTSAVGYALL